MNKQTTNQPKNHQITPFRGQDIHRDGQLLLMQRDRGIIRRLPDGNNHIRDFGEGGDAAGAEALGYFGGAGKGDRN